MKEEIISVGIDVGTSTTAVVFSNISIENTSGSARIPQYKIVGKEVFYRSPMYFTPLTSNTRLDVDGLMNIVKTEYEKAGIGFDDVSTGAVIITGDTARKENAADVLKALSKYAGDFVVATAGPEMEGIIAGKGSGADLYSYDKITTIANFDIGGGTTNVSVFRKGKLLDVACFDIGGRLIRFEDGSLKISYIYHKIKELAADLGINAQEGASITESEARLISDKMADYVIEAARLKPKTNGYDRMVTNRKDFKGEDAFPVLSFSGGVGELIYNPNPNQPFAYNDLGVVLAEAIAKKLEGQAVQVVKPVETIGATVVGAGSHSMEISGSTIFLSDNVNFPIKNLSILKAPELGEGTDRDFVKGITQRIQWMVDADGSVTNAALYLVGEPDMPFRRVQELAKLVIEGMESITSEFGSLTVVLKNDFAKVLGQSIRLNLPREVQLVVIDSISADDGDYIDIGHPIGSGSVLPVIVKTLIFNY